MATFLPALPRGTYKIKYVSNYLDLQSSAGGEVQRVSKMGDRFALETTFKVWADQGLGLVAKLNSNRGSKVRVIIPQALDIGSPGSSVLSDGANQGTTLNLKGLPVGYALQPGQFITVVKSGKRYLHQIVEADAADAFGKTAATIVPMLRAALVADDVVEVAEPTIEGFLQTRETEWVQNDQLRSVEITVSVMEAE